MTGRSAMLLDLDSFSQRQIIARSKSGSDASGSIPAGTTHPLAGVLRAAVLYGEQIVITDSQIFDGALILELGPGGFADLLGYNHHAREVRISLRAATAARSLAEMHEKASFEWQVVRLGWPAELIRRRQNAWARAIDNDNFAVLQRIPHPDFTDELATRLAASVPEGKNQLVDSLLGEPVATRSEMHQRAADSGVDEGSRRRAETWWDAAYMDVLANQHDASWINSALSEDETGTLAARTEHIHTIDRISRLAMTRLAELSGSEFSALRLHIRAILARQREKPTRWHRFRLRIAILDGTKRSHPVWAFVQSLGRIAAWVGVLILALVDTRGAGHWLAVIVSIAGIIVQIPYAELWVLGRSFSRTTQSFIRDPIGQA